VTTLAACLARAAIGDGALVYAGERGSEEVESHAELWERARIVAGGLVGRGLVPGDRVVVAVGDPAAFVGTFFGVAAAGLVPVPLPAHSGMRAPEDFARQFLPAAAASRARLFVADARTRAVLAGVPRVVEPHELTGAPVCIAGPEEALVQYTSGSTAGPRGVVHTHASVLANAAAIADSLALDARDVGVSWLPLFHDMGLIGSLITAVRLGMRLVLMPPLLFAKQPRAWLAAISRHRATASWAPPSAYAHAARRVREIEGLDLSSWRLAGVGAEPVRAADLESFAARFAPVGFDARAFSPGYGLAEHAVAVALGPVGRGLRTLTLRADRLAQGDAPTAAADGVRLVACGRQLAGHEIAIVDEAGNPVSGRVGEIWARGPSRMRGYDTDRTGVRDWIATGDLGFFDDGDLFVCGRIKELIVRDGRKFHPRDIEWALADLDDVGAAVAFGSDPFRGAERVVVVVERARKAGGDSLCEAVRTRVAERCGVGVDEVVLVRPRSLPRTTSGKLQRMRARRLHAEGRLA
jgi:fatty-acyl-CoA synthase